MQKSVSRINYQILSQKVRISSAFIDLPMSSPHLHKHLHIHRYSKMQVSTPRYRSTATTTPTTTAAPMPIRWTDQHDRVAQVHVRTHHRTSSVDQMVDYMLDLYPELDRETVRMHIRFWTVFFQRTWGRRTITIARCNLRISFSFSVFVFVTVIFQALWASGASSALIQDQWEQLRKAPRRTGRACES